MNELLVKVEPKTLVFSDNGRTQTLTLHKVSVEQNKVIAFKLQTNKSVQFTVKPVYGYLDSEREQEVVNVKLHGIFDAHQRYKLLVRAMEVPAGDIPRHESLKTLWNSVAHDNRQQKILIFCEYEGKPLLDKEDKLQEPYKRNSEVGLNSSETMELPSLKSGHSERKLRNLRKIALNESIQSDDSQKQSSSELMLQGSEQLRNEKVTEAISTFSEILKRLSTESPLSYQRAQALIGLGEAYEKCGMHNRSVDSYKATLPIYDACKDKFGGILACGLIAKVYAEMNLPAFSAAWYQEQLSLLATTRGNDARRASVVLARDIQLRRATQTDYEAALKKARSEQTRLIGQSVVETNKTPQIDNARPVETFWESLSPVSSADEQRDDSHRPKSVSMRADPKARYLQPTAASQAWASKNKSKVQKPSKSSPRPLNHSNTRYRSQPRVTTRKDLARSKHVQRVKAVRPGESEKKDSAQDLSPKLDREYSTTICALRIMCKFNGKQINLVLPGPRKAKNLSIGEIREQISMVSGIPLEDFQLSVAQIGLEDSWLCSDVAIHNDCILDLALLPHIESINHSNSLSKNRDEAVPEPAHFDKRTLAKADDYMRIESMELARLYIDGALIEHEALNLEDEELTRQIMEKLAEPSGKNDSGNESEIQAILRLEKDISDECELNSKAIEEILRLREKVAERLSTSSAESSLPGFEREFKLGIVVTSGDTGDLHVAGNSITNVTRSENWEFDKILGPIEYEEFVLGFPDNFLPLDVIDNAQFWFSFGPVSPLRHCGYDALTRYVKHIFSCDQIEVKLRAIEISKQTGNLRDLLLVPSMKMSPQKPIIMPSSVGLTFSSATAVKLADFREFLQLRKRIKSKVMAAQGHLLFSLEIKRGDTDGTRWFYYIDIEPSMTKKFLLDWEKNAKGDLQSVINAAKRSTRVVLCPVVTDEFTDAVQETLSLFKSNRSG